MGTATSARTAAGETAAVRIGETVAVGTGETGTAGARRTAMTGELNQELMRYVRLLKASAARLPTQDRSASLLLWPLLHEGPMRLRDLAAAKGADQSTVSRQVAQLVDSGLVRREIDSADRRACRLAITESGRDACRRMIDDRRRTVEDALQHWSDDQIEAFTEQFHEFNEAFEAVEAQRERDQRVAE